MTTNLLMVLAGCVAAWQVCYCASLVVTILVATRTLGISARSVGLCYVGLGAGTVFASLVGGAISRRIGPGPCLALGFGICACSWLLLAAARIGPMGVAMFASSLMLLGLGAVIIFVNFISLRQAVHALAHAGADDHHDALGDPGSGRPRRTDRRLAGTACRSADRAGIRRLRRCASHACRLAKPASTRHKIASRPLRSTRRHGCGGAMISPRPMTLATNICGKHIL